MPGPNEQASEENAAFEADLRTKNRNPLVLMAILPFAIHWSGSK